jgi:DNA-binding HxlR family transcriptional regulator
MKLHRSTNKEIGGSNMKVATNTLATLVLIGIISLSSVNMAALDAAAARGDKANIKRLERLYQRHDRKLELRASLLGITPAELREQLKTKSLDVVVKRYGFRDRAAYYIALTGKLKDELRKRGWSERKFEVLVQKRLARLSTNMPGVLMPSM